MKKEANENEREGQVYVGVYVSKNKFDDRSYHTLKLCFNIFSMKYANTLLNNRFLCANH